MNEDLRSVLRASGLPAALIARMEATTSSMAGRCYQHPESPTGYVGAGRWCQHRQGHTTQTPEETR
jgi:hypothetical protein